jgi:PKD repeat protein
VRSAVAVAAIAATFVALAGAASAAADLQVADADVALGVRSPTQDNTVTLSVTVHNPGDANATSFTVTFYLDSTATQIASVAAAIVPSGGSATFNATWNVGSTSAGAHTLIAWADSANVVVESSDANNQGSKAFDVNMAPTAAAGVNATSHLTYEPFLFDSGGSTDTDGSIVSYLWVFDDGTSATGDGAQHAFADGALSPGKTYRVTLVVTDDDGGSATAQVSVEVINRAPSAFASNVAGLTKTPLVFDGAGSLDTDGRIVNATWVFTDGVTRYGLTILRTFDDNGAYGATLTVRDDDGASAADSITISITNQPAVPAITTSPVMPLQANQSAVFDGRNSYDVDGGITNYTWLFPGGVTVFGLNATHMFTQNGSYNVTLVLVDDDGAVSQLTIVALVGNSSVGTRQPAPPVARIAASALTVFTGVPVVLDGSNSTDDTGIVSYQWSFGDGATSLGVLTSHAWASDGNFVVALNVTDSDGNSTIATITVHVLNRLPIAALSLAPARALTLADIAFDASSSVDPDGSILYYRWDFGDGTAMYGPAVAHGFSRPAVYSVTLTVTDNDGGEGRSSVLVTIDNRPPVAVVPPNFSVPTFEDRVFDASAAYDLDGVIQTYTWDFGDGGTGTGRSVKHAYATQGAKTVTLTVRDDYGATHAATMTVTVTNNAPSASISAPFSVYTSETATFTGTAVDRDGSIASWSWTFGDGSPASSTPNSLTHAYPTKGTYTVTLTVTDNTGATGSASFEIRVLNRLPTAVISAPTTGVQAPSLSAISFASAGSTDPESGGSLAFFWIFGDGSVSSGPSVSHAFPRAGTYTVILTVSDPDGGASSSTISVVILNQGPTAVGAVNVTTAVPTLSPITFDASGSSDVDGLIVTWLWDFGDGATSPLKVAEHAYASSDPSGPSYTVHLTVTDNGGLKNTATLTVGVTNRLPVARIAHGSPVYAEISSVLRSTDSSDEDGVIVGWAWEFGDQTPAQGGAEVSHVFASAGTYTVKVTVTDNRGGVSSSEETITVVPKPIYDTGKPGQGTNNPTTTPGLDASAGLLALSVVAAAALAIRRRRA